MAKLDPATTPVAHRFVLPERLSNFGQTYGGLTALLLIILYDILFRPHFLQVQSLSNDLQEVAPIAIIATGMTLVIATGGIDLSVGSLMAFAGALAPIIFLSPLLANVPWLGNTLALIAQEKAGIFKPGVPAVSVLQDALLAPILEIEDVRTSTRIDFVGGSRGPGELERLVDSGEASVAFSMFPVSVADLMAVSDAGAILPPKSTWFEPKLRDGLLIHLI